MQAPTLGRAVVAKLRLAAKYGRTGPALRRGLAMLVRGDFTEVWRRLFRGLDGPDYEDAASYDATAAYDAWRATRALTDADRDRLRREAASLAEPPVFSVLLAVAGNRDEDVRRSVDSVLRQTYPGWELCIARAGMGDYAGRDSRIRIVHTHESAGVAEAANAALAAASGDYVLLLDAGDELAEHALSALARAAVADHGLDMLYADEDRLTVGGRHVEPYFKPDWSPDLFLSWMYTGRPGVYRTTRVRRLGGFRSLRQPAHEHDLARRVAAQSGRVGHVPDVLYHRRTPAGLRPDIRPVRSPVQGSPLVSIIIASACRPVRVREERTFYLAKCLESMAGNTWRDCEIIVLHGPKVPPALAGVLDEWGAALAAYAQPFNWARAMNQGAALARGDHLLFLNDDVEVLTPDWLERLLEFSQQPAVGAVGAKLLFPNGRLQHAGVAVLGGRPAHPFYAHAGDHPGYFHNLLVPRNCSAVTGACLMTRAEAFRATGGFDEGFPLNYNDVDYCLRLIAGGRRVVCTPYARLTHHELGTRSAEVRTEERDAFLRRWGDAWAQDPYHNPNLSVDHLDCRIRTTGPSS